MDLSKLPKLSQTDPVTPPPGGTATHGMAPDGNVAPPRRAEAASSPADVWISLAIGIFLLLIDPTMVKYLSSKIFGTEFAPFLDGDGTVVPYPHVYPQFVSDLCVTLFAGVLILEGIALAMVRRRGMLIFTFIMTLLVTAMNLLFVILTTANYGLPMISALAVAIGGYMAMQQFATIQRRRN